MIEIPLTGMPKESVDLVLAERPVTIRTRYANLLGTWSMDILDRETTPPTPLLQGVVITVGVDLLQPYALRLGVMKAVAVDRPGRDPGEGELGSRVKLLHGTAEEFEPDS